MAKNRKKKRGANEKQPQGQPEHGAAGPNDVQEEETNPQLQGPPAPGAAGPSEVPCQELAKLRVGDGQPVEGVATCQPLGAIPKVRPVIQPHPGGDKVPRGPPQTVAPLQDDAKYGHQQQDHGVMQQQPLQTGSTAGSTFLYKGEKETKRPQDVQLIWDKSSQSKLGTAFRPHKTHQALVKSVGTKCKKRIQVNANHFLTKLSKEKVYRYHADFFVTDREIPQRNKDGPVLTRAVEKMKKDHFRPDQYGIVFDGKHVLITAKPLNIDGKGREFRVEVPEFDDVANPLIAVKIKIKFLDEVCLKSAVEEFTSTGTSGPNGNPLPQLQVLNIILNYANLLNHVCLGRNFFTLSEGTVVQLSNGKALWQGTFQSARIGWKLVLNIDVANKPAYKEGPLIGFITEFLGLRSEHDLSQNLRNPRKFNEASRELKGLKVRVQTPNGQIREYRAIKLVGPDSKRVKFKNETGEDESVYDYFRRQYGYAIQKPDLPCLHVGNPNATNYIPLERLRLKAQACPSTKKLSDRQVADIIKKTAVKPSFRKETIQQSVNRIVGGRPASGEATGPESLHFEIQRAFGINIHGSFTTIDARVLNAPALGYMKRGSKPTASGVPSAKVDTFGKGSWRGEMFMDGKSLERWGVLDLSGLRLEVKEWFIDLLYKNADSRGLKINFPIYDDAYEDDHEEAFKRIYENLKTEFGGEEKPDLIMVILETTNSAIYGSIKALGDLDYKIPTQVIQRINVENCSPMTAGNINLKLNSKLMGTNLVLHPDSRPKILNEPVIFIGADVTHASPGDLGQKPSIAAVVASIDPDASQYLTKVTVQPSRSNAQAEETIRDLAQTTRELLNQYRLSTQQKPRRIFYFRDGVSEGQFTEVLLVELKAIQEACLSLSPQYKPGITFVTVQKRHKTRLFPQKESDGVGKMRNVPPGTVVDTDITHPTENSFFLASHEGIQGTTRPALYHPLYDDNNLSADDLQEIIYYLCYLYCRCERSVSYPAPTYYAHLAAERARYYHNRLLMKGLDPSSDEFKAGIAKIEEIRLPNHFI